MSHQMIQQSPSWVHIRQREKLLFEEIHAPPCS